MAGLLLVTGGSLVGTVTPRTFQKKERKDLKGKEHSWYLTKTVKLVYTIL